MSGRSGTVRMAVGQAVPTNGNVLANVEAAARLAEAAADSGARLLVLPEAFTTGYSFDAFADAVESGHPAESDVSGEWLAPVRSVAAERGITVLLCTPLVRVDGTVTLTLLLVDGADGSVEAVYDKQHIDPLERQWFAGGAPEPTVLDIDGVRVGLAICYDSRFPEHAAAAAGAGADVYAVSVAYLAGSTYGRASALPARALDNGMYVLAAAGLGDCDGLPITGGSRILDPLGEVLVSMEAEEGVIVADIDLARVDEVRSRQTMHADRRLV